MTTDPLPQRVKHFYERISVEREGALGELPELYSEDVHFINPVVDERGLRAFEKNWVRALKSYKVFRFENIELVGDEHIFTLTYTMQIRFSFGPTFTTEMATDCHGRDGKVFFCRDYFDPLGTLVQPFPVVSWAYKKIFGLLVA
jgi:ketosteroid isomerase-like protein